VHRRVRVPVQWSVRRLKACHDCHSETRPVLCTTAWKARPTLVHASCNCKVFCCVTCWRARKKASKHRDHGRMLTVKYKITDEQYEAIYEAQGRRCAITGCNAQGISRRLCVDHDHACAESHGGVVLACCVRGLLCKRCNSTLGDYRDNPLSFISFANYLYRPPAFAVLGTDPRPYAARQAAKSRVC
jgi:recombination endonuclease VII